MTYRSKDTTGNASVHQSNYLKANIQALYPHIDIDIDIHIDIITKVLSLKSI